ncbi:MAG: mandelate racemase/muconate lactonizing enzyme family protein [Planctomycetota bacterium]
MISSLELLRDGDSFICRVRSEDGATGYCIGNGGQLRSLFGVFNDRLRPFFLGRDATDLERLLAEVYVHRSNYKLQGLALWVPLATIEFALLDMLGRIAGRSIGELIGEVQHSEVAVYAANSFRGRSADESIELIRANIEATGARALKFKVGGRMSNNRDDPPGRTERLIPMVRQAFGDDMVVYADANGSYDVDESIRIGRLMQEHGFAFFEEPTPFDWYEETRAVADALTIPIAGGEQEPSLRNFRWLIGNDGLDIVQPDLFYFGGMIRSMRVARMAAARGKPCVPHISGWGAGYLYMLHFVSALPNTGPYHEFKGLNPDLPITSDTSDLGVRNGAVRVPTGPGSGVEIDPAFVARHQPV